jgi:hypothetical protein
MCVSTPGLKIILLYSKCCILVLVLFVTKSDIRNLPLLTCWTCVEEVLGKMCVCVCAHMCACMYMSTFPIKKLN